MSQTKIVIICLILLMAIFFFGLSLNLIDKPPKKHNEKDRVNEVTSYSEIRFAKTINNLLSSFAPKITSEDINFKKCAKTSTGFYLNKQNKTCEFIILGFNDDFKKLILIPDSKTARLAARITEKIAVDYKAQTKFWPNDFNDKIEFVFLGKKGSEGKPQATLKLEACPGISADDCPYFANRKRIEITIE